ncbi:MAG: GIY-YIG nuclease family protein [Anaerolineae bacterium]|nr:GIY-YIG nuclease family protein [Anaerolineae bacterium]
MINWRTCQEHAEGILASGIYHLKNTPAQNEDWPTAAGNYLISYRNQPAYIGEAKNLAHRLAQQANIRTSHFYKNYCSLQSRELPSGLNIGDFPIQVMPHGFGRKEIEEFGIVDLSVCLNKFQKNKRQKFSASIDPNLWSAVQSAADKLLHEGELLLLEQQAVDWFEAIAPNNSGLYWVELPSNEVIYVGESSSIEERYNTHSSQTYFSALRRHIGTELLGFTLIQKKGKKRYFTKDQDQAVTNLLRNCKVRMFPIRLGRYELETHLIQKYRPILNRKDNY